MKKRSATPPAIPVISIFSGAGGLDLGFRQAGFKPVMAIDISSAACKTLRHNDPHVQVIRKDASKIDLERG
jgi:DNA (cytosine-5)-methyltransferase 1